MLAVPRATARPLRPSYRQGYFMRRDASHGDYTELRKILGLPDWAIVAKRASTDVGLKQNARYRASAIHHCKEHLEIPRSRCRDQPCLGSPMRGVEVYEGSLISRFEASGFRASLFLNRQYAAHFSFGPWSVGRCIRCGARQV